MCPETVSTASQAPLTIAHAAEPFLYDPPEDSHMCCTATPRDSRLLHTPHKEFHFPLKFYDPVVYDTASSPGDVIMSFQTGEVIWTGSQSASSPGDVFPLEGDEAAIEWSL